MSKDVYIFKRIEKKYKVTSEQRDRLLALVSEHLVPDSHGKSTVRSLYLDTPSHLLIRNSIDAKVYKEKLRLRCYGIPKSDSQVFFELKKKYKGVVYKRRISMTLREAQEYINEGTKPFDSQIMEEIDYSMKLYGHPKPAMLISCEREAFYAKDYPNLRLTFDSNLCYREGDGSMTTETQGHDIIPDGTLILEIKTDGAMPIWLADALDCCHIRPTSFSKYGTAYRQTLSQENTKGVFENVTNF